MQPHYIYSPREMTRWVRGICEAIISENNLRFFIELERLIKPET
jgi:hypothetical protein